MLREINLLMLPKVVSPIASFIAQRPLLIVIVLAIVVRVGALVVFAPTLDFNREGNAVHGSESYDNYAQNLLATGVYGLEAGTPDAMLPPVYSYTLAGVYAIFGRSFISVGIYHILLDVLAIVLLYHIAVRIFKHNGRWIGALAGLGFAFYPYLVFQNMTTTDTGLWIVQIHAYVLLMVLLRERDKLDRRTLVYAVLAGLVLGFATMTRPITPLFAILTGLWLLTHLSLWQMVVRLLPVAVVGVGLVVPWMIRNYGIYDDLVTMTVTSGGNLWQGNNPWTVPVFRAGYDVQWTPKPEGMDDDLPILEEDKIFLDLGVQYWRDLAQDEPAQLLELFWVKFVIHWSIPIAPLYNPQPGEQWDLRDHDGGFELVILSADDDKIGLSAANTTYDSGLMATVGRPLHTLYFGAALLLAIAGIVVGLRREASAVWLIIAVQLSMTITYMVFHPSTRYRSPTDPMLFLLTAYVLVWLGQRFLTQRTASQPISNQNHTDN
jgi:hypothetical protein